MKKTNVKMLVEDNSSTEVPSLVARTKREAIKILECGGNVLNLEEFNDSFAVMYSAVTKDGSKLSICSDKLKRNQRLVYAAILNHGRAIFDANPMYLDDKTAIKYAFISGDEEMSLKLFKPEFSKDYDIAFFAVTSNKDELDNVDISLRNNSSFIMAVNREFEHAEKVYRNVV